ncbi:hypothetical protein HZC30_04750 [Candidatus Woesearchaeota archaeon]|nr:hypothetical protein [Candidatus Woesearchaeota archaeon]
MKKVVISIAILAMVLFVVGCLDYKAYDVKTNESVVDESAIQKEIADIEKQITEEGNASAAVTEEGKPIVEAPKAENESAPAEVPKVEEEAKPVEVVLPKLSENETSAPKETPEEAGNLQIIKVKENQLAKLNLKLNDPDKDKIEFAFSKPFNKAGEWKTNYGDAGEYVVTITATDGKLTTEKKVKVVVERVNVAPIIDNIKDLAFKEGDIIKYTPIVTDPNKDPLTITVSEPLSGGSWTTDHKSSGEYLIKISASDGEMKTDKSFKLTVKDVNLPPVVSGLKDLMVKEGELIKLEPVITDLDGDQGGNLTVTYSKPIGKDGTWLTKYTDHGAYEVNVTVDDGRGAVISKLIKITVSDVNMPPTIDDIALVIK